MEECEYSIQLRIKGVDSDDWRDFIRKYLETLFRGLIPDYVTIIDIKKTTEISVIRPANR